MTRAKDELDLIVPHRFFTYSQAKCGDRHLYASVSRFYRTSSRLNRLWLLVLGLSKTRGETRMRPIKVVPKNEKEVGVSH